MPLVKGADGQWILTPPTGQTPTGLPSLKSKAPSALRREREERQNLINIAQRAGLTKEAEALAAPPKLSLLQRIGRGLTAF